jgi:hypothetical protein
MPLSKYFGGGGEKVMKNMKKEYGEEKGEKVFYATSNKKKKHEKSESKTKEKLETGPSMNFKKKFGIK